MRLDSTTPETKKKNTGEHEQACHNYIHYYIKDVNVRTGAEKFFMKLKEWNIFCSIVIWKWIMLTSYFKVEKDSNSFQGVHIYSTNIRAILIKFQISKV